MARKKTIDELRIEREKAEQDLKLRQENLKKLKAKEAELTRAARTHRLCTHGAMLEQYLSPEEFTDEQYDRILKALFRRSDNLEMIIHAPERELRSSPDGLTTAWLSSECQASVPGNATAFPAQAKACYPFALAP